MIYVSKEKATGNQAALVQLADLNIYSHKIFQVKCDLRVSDKCRNVYNMEYRQFIKLINNNDGKLPCLFCSRTAKFSGRSNPNTKYKSLDDKFFKHIDSKEKAYLLGWIASDGHISKTGFSIGIHQKDIITLNILKQLICKELPTTIIIQHNTTIAKFDIYSKEISQDLCKLLNISAGKKSHTVNFPILLPEFNRYFLRGYFEGDGTLNSMAKIKINKQYKKRPICSITSSSSKMLEKIQSICDIPCNFYKNQVIWNTRETLLFLDYIYTDLSQLYLERKYQLYIEWKNNYEYRYPKNKKYAK